MTRFLTLLVACVLAVLLLFVEPVRAGCEPELVGPWTPTGIAGCETYGQGTASMWGGPGIARNDCVWPWTDCQPIVITSLDTGRSITVVPSMFGDLYTGTADERIVDLDPAAVAALGLETSRGLWPVKVEPMQAFVLPDTAVWP